MVRQTSFGAGAPQRRAGLRQRSGHGREAILVSRARRGEQPHRSGRPRPGPLSPPVKPGATPRFKVSALAPLHSVHARSRSSMPTPWAPRWSPRRSQAASWTTMPSTSSLRGQDDLAHLRPSATARAWRAEGERRRSWLMSLDPSLRGGQAEKCIERGSRRPSPSGRGRPTRAPHPCRARTVERPRKDRAPPWSGRGGRRVKRAGERSSRSRSRGRHSR